MLPESIECVLLLLGSSAIVGVGGGIHALLGVVDRPTSAPVRTSMWSKIGESVILGLAMIGILLGAGWLLLLYLASLVVPC